MDAPTKEAPPKWPKTARIFGDLLAALDITANKLAGEISTEDEPFSQQTINNYATGFSKPSHDVLAAILRRWPAVDSKWLLTGKGTPFPNGRFNEKVKELDNTEQPSDEPDQPPPAGGMTLSHSLQRVLAKMTDVQRADFWQGRCEEIEQRANGRESDLLDRLEKKLKASADAATRVPFESVVEVPSSWKQVDGLWRAPESEAKQFDLATGQLKDAA